MLISHILEARKHSLKGNDPKLPLYEYLKQIYDHNRSKRLFVTFTSVNKVGINPQSSYDTPIGIYSYPLDYIVERLRGRRVPFADSSPYVNVFEARSDAVVWDMRTQPLPPNFKTKEELVEKLVEVCEMKFHIHPEITRRVVTAYTNAPISSKRSDQIYLDDPAPEALPTGAKVNYARLNHNAVKWKSSRDVFFSIVRLSTLPNIMKAYSKRNALDLLRRDVDELSDEELTSDGFYKPDNTNIEWFPMGRVSSSIFRALGIDGIIDNGESTIHKNEPFQAVFFSTSAIHILDTIKNTGWDLPKSESEIAYLKSIRSNNRGKELTEEDMRRIYERAHRKFTNSAFMSRIDKTNTFLKTDYNAIVSYMKTLLKQNRFIEAYAFSETILDRYDRKFDEVFYGGGDRVPSPYQAVVDEYPKTTKHFSELAKVLRYY